MDGENLPNDSTQNPSQNPTSSPVQSPQKPASTDRNHTKLYLIAIIIIVGVLLMLYFINPQWFSFKTKNYTFEGINETNASNQSVLSADYSFCPTPICNCSCEPTIDIGNILEKCPECLCSPTYNISVTYPNTTNNINVPSCLTSGCTKEQLIRSCIGSSGIRLIYYVNSSIIGYTKTAVRISEGSFQIILNDTTGEQFQILIGD